VGRVPYEQLPDYFRAADACVSIPRSDSSPRSVWEAMACGCPCVLSDLPWTSELIEPGRHALVVEPQPGPTAAAVERVLTDAALAARLRAEGRALVEEHHDRRVEMDRLSGVYASVAEGSRR
jgi:glycosyltransferase involved in cell wall biosynthesis